MATHSSVLAWRIPGTGKALWAAICGVTQSRTRLKRLSSRSNTVCSPFSNCFFFFIKQSEEDVSQFDSKFTRQTPVDSPDDSALSESANQVFLVSERLSSVAMGNLNMRMGPFQ